MVQATFQTKTPEQLERERVAAEARKIWDETHSVSEISKLPSDVRYWGLAQESMTYDSGYGERGQPDMSTTQYLSITYFDTDEALEAWVLKAVENRKTYKIFRAEPVNTQVKAVFSIQK
jgi:hypothetical protein